MANEEKFAERLKLIEDTVAMKPTDRVPYIPMVGAYPYFRYGCTWKDSMYNYEVAADAFVKFHEEYQPDAFISPLFFSGKANEIAESAMLDWPGRLGTSVPDESTYQFIEEEFLHEDEYPELLGDYTGFMLRKYIPRAFPGLSGLANLMVSPYVLSADMLAGAFNPDVLGAYEKLGAIAGEVAKAGAAMGAVQEKAVAMGFPRSTPAWVRCPSTS